MKRILKRLPHIRRRDDFSDRRPASQPKPAETAPSRSSTVFFDAEGDEANEGTNAASKRRPKTAQSKNDTPSNRNSTFSQPQKRESGLVSDDQPVDNPSIQGSDPSRSNNRNADHSLHLGPQDTSLYDDLSYLTLGGDSREASEASRKRYSEDVADRNLMANEKGPLSENTSGRKGSISVREPAQVDEFSEDIADRNIEQPSTSNNDPFPKETQEQMNRRIATQPFFSDEFYEPRFEQLSERTDSRRASIPAATAPWKLKSKQVPLGHHVNADSGFLGEFDTSSSLSEPGVISGPGPEASNESFRRKSLPHKAQGAPKTEYNDLDFNDSTDTDSHTRYAPAVTHETVMPEVRQVKEEVVTREIHSHDVYHRILPIKEVEVLPAKHFVRSSSTGKLTEVPTPPGREGEHQNWKIVSTEHDSGWQPSAPRPFTARTFERDDGMAKKYMGEDGVPRTEMTWIRPPTIQDAGQKTGQTEELFMDELYDPPSRSKSKGISGGWSDGVHD